MPLQLNALFSESYAGADDHRAGQGHHAADHVHDAGTRVVGHARAQSCQPAGVAPRPVAVDRVNQGADDEAVGKIGVYLGALGHGAGDYRRGRACEDHLE